MSEPVCDLRDLDPSRLPRFSARNEDDESFNLRYAVAASACLRDRDVVLLADFDWFRLE